MLARIAWSDHGSWLAPPAPALGAAPQQPARAQARAKAARGVSRKRHAVWADSSSPSSPQGGGYGASSRAGADPLRQPVLGGTTGLRGGSASQGLTAFPTLCVSRVAISRPSERGCDTCPSGLATEL